MQQSRTQLYDATVATADVSVLVVDDDGEFREELTEYLRGHGMHVADAGDVAGALDLLAAGKFDLILLDLWIGRENGFDLLRELRKTRQVPCIMMTAQDDVTDKIVGLELGADDYMFKPVNPRELLARARSLLRRTAKLDVSRDASSDAAEMSSRAHWQFDPARRSLNRPDGQIIPLTTAEGDLLAEFVANEGRSLSRIDLSRRVFNRHWNVFDRSLDGIVVKLRRKLEPNPDQPRVIKTVRGKGYVFTGFAS
ncbi:MAG TPA: response regulator transcription factor [Rhizomicrobium sp.]|nr:response regulator transcription factor [Rhizomicrobium sp.]